MAGVIKKKEPQSRLTGLRLFDKSFEILNTCGETGIRTPGPLTVNGFQDRRIKPLCHLSWKWIAKVDIIYSLSKFRPRFLNFFLGRYHQGLLMEVINDNNV